MIVHAGWVVFHVAGAVVGHTLGWWLWYWIAFAALEAIGLLSGAPLTWTVRGFLAPRRKGAWRLRHATVIGWSMYFVGTFWLYAPLPDLYKGVIGLAFYLWLGDHFLHPRYYEDEP